MTWLLRDIVKRYLVISGKIHSNYLEFNIVEHCNNRCEGCSHFSPYIKNRFADIDIFKQDITALSEVFHVEVFRFVGGEPLLHPGLLDFIKVVRESGIADHISICTNGLILHKMGEEFFKAIDRLAISRYPNEPPTEERVAQIVEKCTFYNVECLIDTTDYFSVKFVEYPIKDAGLRHKIFNTCIVAHRWNCHTIHNGYYYLCTPPTISKDYLNAKGMNSPGFAEIDGINLHQPSLFQRLGEYLTRKEPLESCKFCIGTAGKRRPWKKLGKNELGASLKTKYIAEKWIDNDYINFHLRWNRIEKICFTLFPLRIVSKIVNGIILRWDPERKIVGASPTLLE